ncbi:MAG: hypothetical protein JWO44_1051 [Bacteroidetes bacterium]|nr:hypothetical protein [Bacteroidota bacterium]
MKKLIIAAVVLVIMTVKAVAGPVVTIHFEIGRNSLQCAKFGICNAGVDVEWKLSTMQINDQTNELQITISKEMIAGKEEYFKGNTVTFEEAVVLSAEIQKALGSKVRISIETGTYKLIKTRSGFQINIPLNK